MGSGLLSPLHIVILLLVVLLVFGAKRLPELGRGLGSGMREFKDSVTGNDAPEPERPAVTPAVEHVPPVVTAPAAPVPSAEPRPNAAAGSAEHDKQGTSAARSD